MTVRSGSDALSIEFERGVLTLTNNDPPRNRMVRALVFTAMGDEHFSVGMDLKQLTGASPRVPFPSRRR